MERKKRKKRKKFISWLSVYGLLFLVFIMRLIPIKLVYAFGKALTVLYYNLAHKNRQIALNNLKIAMGQDINDAESEIIIRGSFKTMGHIILDTLHYKDLSKERIKNSISIEGIENLRKALKKGKGVIGVSAHLGSFTIMGARLTIEGYKASFVARHARNKGVERIMIDFSRKAGQKIIFNRPLLPCIRLCRKVLERNEILIIEMDQNFGIEGLRINFFNQPAMAATGPIKIALNTQAALVPMFIIRIDEFNHVIRIEPEIELKLTGDNEMDIRCNLQRTIDVVEKFVRNYPSQWVNWIHKQWEVSKI